MRDAAVFFAHAIVRAEQRASAADVSFSSITIDDVPDIVPTALHLPPSPPSTPYVPRQAPGVTTPSSPAPLPKAAAALADVARERFQAAVHGPVELPFIQPVNLAPGTILTTITGNNMLHMRGSVEDRAFAIKRTLEELNTGAIVEERNIANVRALLPCFVVTNANGKKRLIFDGRALNKLLRRARGTVSYESVRDALYVRARYATKLDIEAAFRHVAVKDDDQRWLCFAMEGRVFRYKTLPFGLSWSPTLFYNCLRPTVDRLRRQGIRLVWYVDDFLVTADSVDQLDDRVTRVVRTLHADRWRPAPDKSYPYAYDSVEFLGLQVSYRTDGVPVLSVPEDKIRKIVDELTAMFADGTAHVIRLQKAAGRIAFCQFVSPRLALASRTLHHAIRAADRSPDGRVNVVGLFAEELAVLLQEVRDRLPATERVAPVFAERSTWTVYSDASETGWGALRLGSGPFRPPEGVPTGDVTRDQARGWAVAGPFTPEECRLSSAAREVRAILYSIQHLGARSVHLRWHSDATAAVGAISRWASPASGVASALVELFDVIEAADCDIEVSHVLRDCDRMPVADWLSRQGWRDRQAEWSVSDVDYVAICEHFRVFPEADMFASASNHKADLWCSRFLEEASLGDAFDADWSSRSWWAFPPFAVLLRLATALERFGRHREAVSGLLQLSSSSSAASAAPSPTQILLMYPLDTRAPWWSPLAAVCRRWGVRTALIVPPSHSIAQPRSPICPQLRLIGDEGRPAPDAPRLGLQATLLRFAS